MKKLLLLIIAITVSSFVFSQENLTPKKELTTSQVSSKNIVLDKDLKQKEFLKQKQEKYLILSDSDYRTDNNIPETFPEYKDTGDIQNDTTTFEILFKKWKNANPEKYNQIKEIINI